MGRAHNFIDRRGEKHISNEGEPVVIIEYFNEYNNTPNQKLKRKKE